MYLPLLGETSLLVLGGACCCTWCCCQWIFAMIAARKPWPTFQGNVVSIGSLSEWYKLLGNASANNQLVIVDCFAYWCPPCKLAASVYAQMSLEYEDAVFAKVDVDAANDVARLLEVSAMPTFLLFGNAEAANRSEPNYVCLDKCVGWSESAVRRMLESQGVKRVQGDVKCPHQSGSGPGEEKQSLISSQV